MTPARILSLFLSFCLIFEQAGFAQTIDLSHYFAHGSIQNIPQTDKFRPLHLRYISYDSQANDFKLLLDKGDFFNQQTPKLSNSPNSSTPKLEEATQELMKYFFIGLSLPNEKFWVNLRPDSPDNILDPDLEKTNIGRIFLEADLQLKKDTSSMTSPQNPEGKAYWDKLYKKAGELFGNENITIPTITRPWIVPNEIIIREAPDNAYIYKATLKVMLEEDYLKSSQLSAGQKAAVGLPIAQAAVSSQQYNFQDPRLKELNEYSTQLIKETIIPKLTYAVNTAKRYAPLRQVYYSLILAQWFKQKYGSSGSARASGTSAPVNSYVDLIDSGNLANLTSKEPYDKQTYFQQYQKSFKYGEYSLQEPVYTPMGQSIRRYTSGGAVFDGIPKVMSQGRVNSSLELSPALISKNMQMNISSPLDPNDISNTKKTSVVSSAAEGGFDLDDGSICRIEPLTKDLADQRYNEILDLVNAVPGSNWGKDKLIEEYSGKWQNSFVVVRDKKIIAILLAYEQEPNAELKIGDRHIFIRRLCVAEEFRHKHIATHLLNYLSSQVKAKGYRPIALQTNVDNAEGNLLYRKLDFTNVATIKAGEYRDNIYVIDAIKLSHTTQNVIMESVNLVIREEKQDIFGLERVNYLGNEILPLSRPKLGEFKVGVFLRSPTSPICSFSWESQNFLRNTPSNSLSTRRSQCKSA